MQVKKMTSRPALVYVEASEWDLHKALRTLKKRDPNSWMACKGNSILSSERKLQVLFQFLTSRKLRFEYDLPEQAFTYGEVIGFRPTAWGWEIFDAADGEGDYEWL